MKYRVRRWGTWDGMSIIHSLYTTYTQRYIVADNSNESPWKEPSGSFCCNLSMRTSCSFELWKPWAVALAQLSCLLNGFCDIKPDCFKSLKSSDCILTLLSVNFSAQYEALKKLRLSRNGGFRGIGQSSVILWNLVAQIQSIPSPSRGLLATACQWHLIAFGGVARSHPAWRVIECESERGNAWWGGKNEWVRGQGFREGFFLFGATAFNINTNQRQGCERKRGSQWSTAAKSCLDGRCLSIYVHWHQLGAQGSCWIGEVSFVKEHNLYLQTFRHKQTHTHTFSHLLKRWCMWSWRLLQQI